MAVSVVCLILIFYFLVSPSDANYCVCNSGQSDSVLQKNIDYACGHGADCTAIQPNGACYNPNTLKDHCSYAVNSYFQKKGQTSGSCDFQGTATVTPSAPSGGSGCAFQSTPSNGGTMPTPPSAGSTTTPPTSGGTTLTPPSTGGTTTPPTSGGTAPTPPSTGGSTTPPTNPTIGGSPTTPSTSGTTSPTTSPNSGGTPAIGGTVNPGVFPGSAGTPAGSPFTDTSGSTKLSCTSSATRFLTFSVALVAFIHPRM